MYPCSADPSETRAPVRKRVAHLTSVHDARDGRIYQRECRSLYEAGYDVVLIGNGESFDDPAGPKIEGIQRNQSRFVRIALGWLQVLRMALRSDAVLFHLHDPELIPLGLILKVLGKRVIFDCHEYYARDMRERDYIPRPLRRILAVGVYVAMKLADRCFDAIIVAVPGLLPDFSSSNTTLINNYPEWEIDTAGRKKFGDRPALVAYAGVISERRGIREMVAAMDIASRRSDVKLLLIGKFSPPKLLDEIRALPGWSSVDYRGQATRDEVKQLLQEAIAGLVIFWDIGNHRNSSPNKLFEYMAAGLPTIITDFASWRALLDPVGASLPVDPRDPNSIADKMCWVAENRDEAERMGMKGQQAVSNRFSWKSESEKLIALYGKLLAPQGVTR